MARIRSIKPEFWKSEAIARHDFFTRLVFIGLWSYVDDNGVGIDHHRLIAAELFPLEDDFASVSRELRESIARLADAGRVRRYTVDGKAYISIVNWSEHQKIDRPNKARYPGPDDPRATPTPPTSPNTPVRETLDEPSRNPRETPSSGAVEQGSRGAEEQGKTPPPPLAPLDGDGEPPADVVDAEIVDEPAPAAPSLFVVPSPEPTNLPAVAESENAGQITKQWIDFCKAKNVKLTGQIIKRYGAGIKRALDEQFEPELIKRALAEMLTDRVASRPALLDNYLIRAQQGAELPPRRAGHTEATIARTGNGTTGTAALIRDALTRPA